MATNTEILGLKKESSADFYNIETFNDNFDKIDAFAGRKDNPHGVTKTQVGLDKVDNTSDANKPVSTAQATAISEAKAAGTSAQANLTVHTNNKSNPHGVTKSQVGLGNVDNTSDLNKPISTKTQTALNGKVDKVTGKGLSTNDFTDADKLKLSEMEVEFGSYVGTGVYNEGSADYQSDKATVINFSRRPKAVLLVGTENKYIQPNITLVYGQPKTNYYTTITITLNCEWTDRYVALWTTRGAAEQFNDAGLTYNYVVIY